MRILILAMTAIMMISFPTGVGAQQARGTDDLRPYASDGGEVRFEPVRPVDAASDPVNETVLAGTTEGIVLTLTISGRSVALDGALAARIPKLARRDSEGEVVRAKAFAGGDLIGEAVVADPIVNILEGEGLVRVEKRQVTIAIIANRPVDRVEVEAAATGARASFDVAGAYGWICQKDQRSKWCMTRPQ